MDAGSSLNGFQALNGSNTSAGAEGNTNTNTNELQQAQQCGVREQDRFMPIANVIRIMRKVLPSHAKISDDAKETIQECVSEYISFITSEANDRCQREQRKTITAEDVLWAMSKLGFDNYIDPLTLFLQKYRDLEGDHRGSIRGDPLPLMIKSRVGSSGCLLSSSGPSVAIPPPLQPAPPTMPLMPMWTAADAGMMGMGWDHQHLNPQHQHHHQHPHYHHHQFQHMMGGYYYGMYGNGGGGGGGGGGGAGDGSNGGGSSSSQHQLDYPNGGNN